MQSPVNVLLKEKGSQIFSAAPHESVFACVQRMNECRVGALLILENQKPVGIFTERDVSSKLVLSKRDPEQSPVSEFMTKNVLVIASSTTVEEAMAIVTQKRFRHLPVMDDGVLLGLISIGDLTKWAVRTQQEHIEHLSKYIKGDY